MIAFRAAILLACFVLLVSPAFALDAPVVSSSTHEEGIWGSQSPVFSWEAVEGAFEYCYVLDSDSSNDAPDEPCTVNTTVQLPKKISSGDYYFHIKAAKYGESSATTTYHIKLDIKNPTKSILSFEALSDGSLELSWTAAEDEESGVKEYEVYKSGLSNFDIRDLSARRIAVVSVPAIGFVDVNNLSQSTTYHYKIRAVDNSGNPGPVSNEVHAQTVAKCDIDIDFSAELSEGKESLLLKITGGDTIYHGGLAATLPDGSSHLFFEEKEPFGFWEESFSLSGIGQGYIDFSLAAKEFFGDECGQEKRFIFDTVEPKLSFVSPKYNDRVSETVPLEVRAEDLGDFKSGLQPIEFFHQEGSNWRQLGSAEANEEGIASLEWNSFDVENGQQKIKVTVADNAGNSVESIQTLTVLNAFESALDLNSAFGKALEARGKAFASKWELEAKAIYSEEVENLIQWGDLNFAEAERLAKLAGPENETNAKVLLAQAILSYKESETTVSTSVYNTADFVFNEQQAHLLFNAAGISGQMMDQALLSIEEAEPKRQLQILSVQDSNSSYYRALISVSYNLDINILKDSNANDLVMTIIEIVPKEFAEYAEELDSNASYIVLDARPALQFSLTRTDYRKKSLVYALKNNLSQEQADALIEESVIKKFVAPPVILPLSQGAAGFGLPIDPLILAASFVAALVVIMAIFFGMRAFKSRRRGRPHSGMRPSAPKSGIKQGPIRKKKSPLSGFRLSKFKRDDESPLSVFGKK